MSAAQAELASIARAVADPQRPLASLIGEMDRLRRVAERHCALPMQASDRMTDGESFLDSGWAISPVQAALCAREPLRSAAFTRGLLQAVTQRLRADRPVRVLYAGSGPFALLALPLMALLSEQQVQVCILEVHAHTLGYARALIGELGYAGHVSDYICADAAAYRIPADGMPDVIISETMNTALGKEPQVAIMRNLHVQAPSAALLPAAVTVHLGLPRRTPEEACGEWGTVFALTAQTIAAWEEGGLPAGEGSRLPGARLRVPAKLEQAPRLLTRIRVHGDVVLGDYDCSLNLPLPLPGKPALTGGEVLDFTYMLGREPGLACRIV